MQHRIDARELAGPASIVCLEVRLDDARLAAAVPPDADHFPAAEGGEAIDGLPPEIARRAGDDHTPCHAQAPCR